MAEKYLYLQFWSIKCPFITEWLGGLIKEDGGEIVNKEWVDFDTFANWLSEDYYANIIIDWYEFKSNEDFYRFMLMCKQHGVTYLWCEETGIELQDYFNSLELLYLMCDKNIVEEEKHDWRAPL